MHKRKRKHEKSGEHNTGSEPKSHQGTFVTCRCIRHYVPLRGYGAS